ncbi:P-loop containing nucleoside triphosphate hydrolase protein [Pavlovales sp. CCMP2436]|nr:P-loop containing nucleoside triphosphate hydrolase protein [Pavlovales sp. CCMP2436]
MSSDGGNDGATPEAVTSRRSSSSEPGAMSSGQKAPHIYARIRPGAMADGERLFDSFDEQKLCIQSKDGQQQTYSFDKVFAPDSKQSDLVDAMVTGEGGVLTALRAGYDATVFAYGQTGSGKTYSMEGGHNWASDPETRGLVPRLFELIFTDLADDPDISELQVMLSFTELYNESIRDLLQAKADLQVYQEPHGGFAPKGAMKALVTSVDEAIAVYLKGSAARATESTNMNATSSRSHALLIVDLDWMVVGRGRTHARLNLLDLAGSEGIVKTGNAVGSQRAKEVQYALFCELHLDVYTSLRLRLTRTNQLKSDFGLQSGESREYTYYQWG